MALRQGDVAGAVNACRQALMEDAARAAKATIAVDAIRHAASMCCGPVGTMASPKR